MRLFSYLITILLVILGITFAILNASLTKINFYFTEVTLNLSLILVLTFAMGVVLGMMLGVIWYLRLKREVHHLQQELKQTALSSKDQQG
jgi:putative membrane protein